MASGVKVTWDRDVIADIMRSDAVGQNIGRAAQKITDKANAMSQIAGAEYRMYVNTAKYCKVALAVCGNYQSRVDEYYHTTLEKAAGV